MITECFILFYTFLYIAGLCSPFQKAGGGACFGALRREKIVGNSLYWVTREKQLLWGWICRCQRERN